MGQAWAWVWEDLGFWFLLNARNGPKVTHELHQLHQRAAAAELEDVDDGFASYGDADVATIHMSAKSTRKPRHPSNHVRKRRQKRREGFVSAAESESCSPDDIVNYGDDERGFSTSPEPATGSSAATAAAPEAVNGSPTPSTPGSGVLRPHLPSAAAAGAILSVYKVDVGVQTDDDVMTDELVKRGSSKHSVLKKYELIGDSPSVFFQTDQWVMDVSKKRYKSLKHIVRLLVDKIEDASYTRRVEDLLKVRAFFKWCTENIA